MRRERLVYLGLAVITLLLYSRVVFSEFVNYDDPEYVSANPIVQRGISWDGLGWAFTTGHTGNWHPVTWLSHMLDCQFFGLWSGGHHLVNVLFHLANTLLLLRLLKQMTGSLWRSALVAALFAWHPLHVESVAWVAERKDVLSTFFFLLSVGAYVRYARNVGIRKPKSAADPTPEDRNRVAWGKYALALVWFALSLMSKPMFVTLPCVLLLLDFWPLERMRRASYATAGANGRDWLGLVAEKTPFFALAVASSLVTLVVQHRGGSVSPLDALPLGARFANAMAGYVAYLGKLFWPVDLAVIYPMRTHWPVWQVATAAGILAGITAAIVLFGRRRRYAIVGWFWFLITLLPVIGLVQVGLQFIADRYTYVPAVGVFVIVIWGGAELLNRVRRGRQVGAALSALVLVACVAVTFRQLGYWRDSVRLFERAVAVTPENPIAHNNLGHALAMQKRLDEARSHFEQALASRPEYAQARRNLATYYSDKQQFDTAIEQCEVILKARPEDAETWGVLGTVYHKLGRKAETLAAYREAVRLRPESAKGRLALGIELAEQGELEPAIEQYQAALLQMKSADLYYHLGNALLRLDKLDAAITRFRAALDLNPEFAEAHNNLANALALRGETARAIGHLREAVALKPDYAEALHNLALLLVKSGQSGEAADYFEKALKLEPDNERAHFELALIRITQRQPGLAIRHLREALRVKPASAVYANALARLLATAALQELRNGAEAVRLAEAACAVTQRQNYFYLDTLAAAYAEAGRFEDAVAAERQAISLAGAIGKTNLAVEFEKHLRLYAEGQPLHEPAP